jgi:hypothetical protein
MHEQIPLKNLLKFPAIKTSSQFVERKPDHGKAEKLLFLNVDEVCSNDILNETNCPSRSISNYQRTFFVFYEFLHVSHKSKLIFEWLSKAPKKVVQGNRLLLSLGLEGSREFGQ